MKKLAAFLIGCLALMVEVRAQATDDVAYIVLIGATNDQKAGIGITYSYDLAKTNFPIVAGWLGLKPKIYEVKGTDFTSPKVIETLKQAENEARQQTKGKKVLFVFSVSHGVNFENTETRLPYMLCNPVNNLVNSDDELLPVQSIFEYMRDSKAFDYVHSWHELCSDIPNGFVNAPKMRTTLSPRNSPLKGLLVGQNTASVMSSSVYGQYSFTSPTGGAFSNALFETLDKIQNNELQATTFDEFFNHLKVQTDRNADKIWGYDVSQIPQYYLEKVPLDVPPAQDNSGNTIAKQANPQSQPQQNGNAVAGIQEALAQARKNLSGTTNVQRGNPQNPKKGVNLQSRKAPSLQMCKNKFLRKSNSQRLGYGGR